MAGLASGDPVGYTRRPLPKSDLIVDILTIVRQRPNVLPFQVSSAQLGWTQEMTTAGKPKLVAPQPEEVRHRWSLLKTHHPSLARISIS